ncbi:MAG: MFS transporter [Acidimicrobiia bacterium]|nr:MFS transporter [Acidimicrobiia bacterium]
MNARLRGTAQETFRSFSIRNFRLFFVGQLISQIGKWLTMVALVLFVLHLTDNGVAIGLLTACQFLPVLLIGAWAGLLADRSDKRRLLMVVQAFAMLQSFALAALAFTGDPPLWSLYLVALAGGFAIAFDSPARRAFVVEMVPEADVNNAVSLNSALMTGARVVGPALAGALIYFFGYGWAFLLDGISYLAVIAGLYLIDPRELRTARVTSRAKGQVRAGLRYVSQVHDLWVPLVMMAIIGTFTFNFQVVLPLFVTRSLGSTSTMYTVLWSVVSLGAVAGALATARRSETTVSNVVAAAATFGGGMLLLAAAPNLWLAYPAGLLMGFTSISFMTSSTAIVQVRADPTMRGRVLALQSMVFLGSTPVGGPILGFVIDIFGARSGVVLGGLAALGAAAWGWRVERAHLALRPEAVPLDTTVAV